MDDFAAGEFDLPIANIFDRSFSADLHAERFELAAGTGGQILRKIRQQTRRGLNENDPRLRGINAPKIAFQNRARQLGK